MLSLCRELWRLSRRSVSFRRHTTPVRPLLAARSVRYLGKPQPWVSWNEVDQSGEMFSCPSHSLQGWQRESLKKVSLPRRDHQSLRLVASSTSSRTIRTTERRIRINRPGCGSECETV